jgi:isochorismate synthase
LDSNRISADFSATAFDGRLKLLLRDAADRFRRHSRPVLASLSLPLSPEDQLAIFALSAGDCRDRLLWSQPDLGFSILGLGAAHVIETRGPRRFCETAAVWSGLCSAGLIEPAEKGCGPLLMGGFSFDTARHESTAWRGFPEGRMVLPRICVCNRDGRSWLTINAVLSADTTAEQESGEIFRLLPLLRTEIALCHAQLRASKSSPVLTELRSAVGWRNEVAAAVRAVRRGRLSKVVLARAVRLDSAQPFDPALALVRLSSGYPTCVVFAIAHDDRCFVGATPERLLRVRDGEVSTTCLAGSYPRGTDEEADRKMAQALLADPKERREHGLVLGALLETLSASCTQVHVPDTPSVLKLSNVQHLCTPLSARLCPGRNILEIVEQLHPTPSVGGQPRDLALRFIREHEGLDRGWYAGTIGWVDHRGEGEFAVAIRAALLSGTQATLFAGCGIVGDSDPEREYAESCMKLTPMLTALGAA